MIRNPETLLRMFADAHVLLYELAVQIQESEVSPKVISKFLTAYRGWLAMGRQIAEHNRQVCIEDIEAVEQQLKNPAKLDWCLWEARQMAQAVRTGVAAGAQVAKKIDEEE